jgi:hypothetical protein
MDERRKTHARIAAIFPKSISIFKFCMRIFCDHTWFLCAYVSDCDRDYHVAQKYFAFQIHIWESCFMGLDDSLFVLWETSLLCGIKDGRQAVLLVVCCLWQVATYLSDVYAGWNQSCYLVSCSKKKTA